MKQILQDMGNGQTQIVDVPAPQLKKSTLLINTRCSLISAGTERMLLDFGKANLFDKARQQPEKVKMVLDKIKTDGLFTTIDAVKSKLAEPIPLGYCNVGIVQESGCETNEFKIGDRVVSNGCHAEVVRVPRNLCAKIPDSVSNEHAAFTVLASIGLQGIRLAQPTMGEAVVVIGAGLIGLITIQMLLANGCKVMAIDFDSKKLALAKKFGAEICNPAIGEDPIEFAHKFSRQRGVDAVLITASTKSNEPISQAARMSRKRGRIIMVGVTGMELNRSEFYEKELSFQVSCSYGPGRYDPEYEAKGIDYPIGFVRWTEQRNFETVLDLMASKVVDPTDLITHRFLFDSAPEAYETLTTSPASLGIILEYTSSDDSRTETRLPLKPKVNIDPADPVVGFIGAGNYASRMLVPAFKANNAQLHTITTSTGTGSTVTGKKTGFMYAASGTDHVMQQEEINTAVIVTRHNSHANFVLEGLNSDKHVFVEKPLALTLDEVTKIENSANEHPKQVLMVGFNRRFSPITVKMKELIETVAEPKAFIMTMNAGFIPQDHWTQDPQVGGGRIIGEACHYIDLMRFLAGSEITSVTANKMQGLQTEDNAIITIQFADGSLGSIHYLANGNNSFPKERVEVFCGGKVLQNDNFKKLTGYGWKGFSKLGLLKQNKGQMECVKAFLDAIRKGGIEPIPREEIFEVSRAAIEAAKQISEKS